MGSHASPKGGTCIIGFDSAWTDNEKSPGAICAVAVCDDGEIRFTAPRLATFGQALDFIQEERRSFGTCLVAIDQPTIVPNKTGCRPVERVAGSLISYIGGGVQPANRSKTEMFGDAAPIWGFLNALQAQQVPELGRTARDGVHVIEVFPALAIPAIEPTFYGRLKGPKYNPERRKTFQHEDWNAVLEAVARFARECHLECIVSWSEAMKYETRDRKPIKRDQDCLDAIICALIANHWRHQPREASIVIGDLSSGYMVSPVTTATRVRLERAGALRGVPVDGIVRMTPHPVQGC